MTQSKKQASAKLASNKAAKGAYAAVETTRNSAENVVKISSAAMKDFISSSASEAQKAQEKAFAMSRENAEHLAKSADAATKMLYEVVGISRDSMETCIECSNMSAALAKDLSSEAFELANKTFSDNMELSKEFFACRTLNDMLELQNRAMRQAMDNFFNQSARLSGMMFEYTTEALEPINERVSRATEQFSKALAA